MSRTQPPSRGSSSSKSKKPPVPKRTANPDDGSGTKPKLASSQSEPRTDTSLPSLLAGALRNKTFLRLVLSQPRSNAAEEASKVTVRLVDLNGETKYQWTTRAQNQERHRNLTQDELVVEAKSAFGSKFADAHLFTTEADLTIRWNHGRPPKIKRKPPTLQATAAMGHNRQKQYLIPANIPCPFLIEVGVMLPTGQVRPTMYHKFRQINRYLEFVEDLIPQLPATGPLHVIDFGCGKSYLTFALHYLLTAIHGRQVQIIGLDVKSDVIDDCNRIATTLGCEGLQFQIGRIETFTPASHVHLTVSLHACDTATDDALAAAIRWQCEAILAVPCCQHEICQVLGRNSLPGLTEYGLLKERFASLATDALRAQFLELHGYRTQVVEFIETEHTPKNVLLRAVRRKDAIDLSSHQAAYEELKQVLGVSTWHLENAVKSSHHAPRDEAS